MKKILGIHHAPPMHWVGNGFPVRSLFSYSGQGVSLSPFLLLDHASPMQFPPGHEKRGVGVHPHRGFETVTLVYQGEVDHRDSTGAGGRIGPGDVQWMTAGAGILHEEFHSERFTKEGGIFEVVQLWVNLPAKDKSAPAGYQTLQKQDIPVVRLPREAGELRVISGEFDGARGIAKTFTDTQVWDAHIKAGHTASIEFKEGHTALIVVLEGTGLFNSAQVARAGQWVELDKEGGEVLIEANNDLRILLLSGEPINEPVVGHGPFVMNTEQEIRQAFMDFQSGNFQGQ